MNKEEILNLKLQNEQNYNDSLIECINKLQQENKQLNKKYLNAIIDYEQEKSKNQKAIEILDNIYMDYYVNRVDKLIIDKSDIVTLLEVLKENNNE